jgi:hypothetical protein
MSSCSAGHARWACVVCASATVSSSFMMLAKTLHVCNAYPAWPVRADCIAPRFIRSMRSLTNGLEYLQFGPLMLDETAVQSCHLDACSLTAIQLAHAGAPVQTAPGQHTSILAKAMGTCWWPTSAVLLLTAPADLITQVCHRRCTPNCACDAALTATSSLPPANVSGYPELLDLLRMALVPLAEMESSCLQELHTAPADKPGPLIRPFEACDLPQVEMLCFARNVTGAPLAKKTKWLRELLPVYLGTGPSIRRDQRSQRPDVLVSAWAVLLVFHLLKLPASPDAATDRVAPGAEYTLLGSLTDCMCEMTRTHGRLNCAKGWADAVWPALVRMCLCAQPWEAGQHQPLEALISKPDIKFQLMVRPKVSNLCARGHHAW